MTPPFCCECKSDFPVAEKGSRERMGFLYPLASLPKRLRDRFRSWADHDEGAYLCGSPLESRDACAGELERVTSPPCSPSSA